MAAELLYQLVSGRYHHHRAAVRRRHPRNHDSPGSAFTGVDVNRNYDTADWGQETYEGAIRRTSRDPTDQGEDATFGGQVFCGMAAESERETAAIADLIRTRKFGSVISYHNFAEDILAPDATFADAFTKSLGDGMKDLIAERGISYAFKTATGLYRTTGDTVDYYIEKVPGKRPGYTIEVSPENPPAILDHQLAGCRRPRSGGYSNRTWRRRWRRSTAPGLLPPRPAPRLPFDSAFPRGW